ncbi:MAG: SCP2 sterol-binding domain-containing protein [Lachnospiraceae bacterium]|nr:SCP2 sterol-binding domain-containing protein [Lachnospiraceae bacterium]MBR5179918.1 SCP2 sterol-binding domain-containing protein [Lachnospiraceae bacterium]MBR6475941.1 SCP2 sterol-binding domain-containing protein [Lachnospiraceae bacterium]
MTFEETLAKVKKIAGEADVAGKDFLAVQVNITEPDGGVFYVEVKDGNVTVEPFEYNDKQCTVTMNNENFNKLLDGDLNPILAFTLGKLKVDGDMGKALAFSNLIKK